MEINNLFESLKVDLTCHICLGYFTEPVIVPCGHSFCNECILNYWKETHTQVTCPICKSVLVFEDFFYNTRLKNLAIIGKILRPYLLQSIRPLTTCTKHGKEEIWFCEEDHRLFCGPCFLSMEHKEHKVLPLEKAAGQCMEKLQAKWNILKDKKQKLRMELEREKRREVQCKEHGPTLKELIRHEYEKMHWFLLEEEWLEFQKQYKVARGSLPVNENKDSQSQGILSLQPVEMLKLDGETMIELVKSQYEKKHQLLSEEQHLHLQRLDQQVEENLAKFVESKAKMTQQIHNLQKVMSEIDKTFDKLPTDLLQDAKGTLERDEELFLQGSVIASPTWTMFPIPGMKDMLLKFHRDISLDPETANPHLILSDDLKSIKYDPIPQDVPDNPKRFDVVVRVLAAQSFTSGKHYWEVELGNKTEWEVGICKESIRRKGNVRNLPGDKQTLVGLTFGNTFHLWCSNHDVPVSQPIHKVGIFLDYERGHIAFYNAADGTFIYSPQNDDFQGSLCPCFSPCFQKLKNTTGSLSICPRKN